MKNQLVDVGAAKTFIEANWPNDPLLRQIATNLLDMLPKVESGWIPVTEGMPDTEQDHCMDEDGSRIVFEISDWLWGIDASGTQARVRYETGPLFQGWCDDHCKAYAITHWMPLPEPPELKQIINTKEETK